MRLIERIWFGDSGLDRAARGVLGPFELLYRGVVGLRGGLYDSHIIKAHTASIPVISIGNVTVGGTGKTPVAARLAERLSELGRSPAIVLRGYGGDEPLVHARLNPKVPVIVRPDRVAGIEEAKSKGANVVILDDAFQHRRAARDIDIVLISADEWTTWKHLLPAGPYREPLSALSRASLVAITRKSVGDDQVRMVADAIRKESPGVPVVVLRLAFSELISRDHMRNPVAILVRKKVLAVAAIGNPAAFFRQVEATGAHVTPFEFPDHHSYSSDDVARILRAASGAEYVVCTLKDAVKLEPLWPADDSRLLYVSLAVNVDQGESVIDEMLKRLA